MEYKNQHLLNLFPDLERYVEGWREVKELTDKENGDIPSDEVDQKHFSKLNMNIIAYLRTIEINWHLVDI